MTGAGDTPDMPCPLALSIKFILTVGPPSLLPDDTESHQEGQPHHQVRHFERRGHSSSDAAGAIRHGISAQAMEVLVITV